MKKRQQKLQTSSQRAKKASRVNWRSIILYIFLLVALVVGVLYASNPSLFAGLQSFAKNNSACSIKNPDGCGSKVRQLILQGLSKTTPKKDSKSAEKTCEESCTKIPSFDARQSCINSCKNKPSDGGGLPTNPTCPGTWIEGWRVWSTATSWDCSGTAKANPYGHPGSVTHSCIRLDNGKCAAGMNSDFGEASCTLSNKCGQ